MISLEILMISHKTVDEISEFWIILFIWTVSCSYWVPFLISLLDNMHQADNNYLRVKSGLINILENVIARTSKII